MIGSYLLYARAAIRGGNWNNEVNAGVFALNLNNAPSNSNNNIGLRVAIPKVFARIGWDKNHPSEQTTTSEI